MPWGQIAKDFNAKFEGKVLPGNSHRQPRRSEHSLRTERNRIKAITDLSGFAPRDQKKSPRTPREVGSDEDEGDDADEDGEEDEDENE